MHTIQPQDRNQVSLFNRLEDLVSPGNPVRLIDMIVDKICQDNPERMVWKGQNDTGRRGYAIETMLKLLLYCYFNKIRGSRKIEQESYRNIELLWLLGNLQPDHWCVCEFRRENEELIRFVTISFRRFLKDHGYIKGKTIAFDGSKMKAYAKREMLALRKMGKRLENLDEQLNSYLIEFARIDKLTAACDKGEKENPLTKENEQLLEKVEVLKKKIEDLEGYKKTMESLNVNYLSPNDPDARLMKSRDGKIPAYNVQSGVDDAHHMIVMAEVHTEINDLELLVPNITELKYQLDITPEEVLADKGYGSLDQIEQAEESNETTCIIPLPDSGLRKRDKENGISFMYDSEHDQFICHRGKPLSLHQSNHKERKQYYNKYKGRECNGCPQMTECTSSKNGRTVSRNVNQVWIDNYKETLSSEKSKEKMERRKAIVEHPFGTIKYLMGKHGFILTRRNKAQIELDLLTTVYNLKRLINIDPIAQLLQSIQLYSWKMA